MSEGKSVQVTNKQTGEVSHLKPGSTPKRHEPETQQTSAATVAAQQQPSDESRGLTARVREVAQGKSTSEVGSGSPPEGGKAKSKPKTQIETFEQFISYAYGLKGRRVGLKSNVQKAIGRDPILSDEARNRLKAHAAEDRLLAVPRQLLLVSLEVREYPRLRSALRDFAREALLGHPIFQSDGLGDVLRNLDGAPEGAQALGLLDRWQPLKGPQESAGEMKATELEELRRNAAYALLSWIAIEKSLTPYDVVIALQQALWSRHVRFDTDDRSAWVRATTDITQVAEVGFACQSLMNKASELAARADRANRDAAVAKDEVSTLQEQLARMRSALADVQLEAQQARQDLEASVKAHRQQHETETTHLRDDLERLRTRVLRRLSADVEQLEVGLSALRTPEPKIHVLQDRLERVADAMRSEVKTLREGG